MVDIGIDARPSIIIAEREQVSVEANVSQR
jgi:hypothetical protein